MVESSTPALKDHFDNKLLHGWASRLSAVYPTFDGDAFVTQCSEGYEELTFTQRSRRMAEGFHANLPTDFPTALSYLLKTLPQDPTIGSGDVLNDGFWMWPVGDFIAAYGADHPDEAMNGCYELTRRFTAEFAIRPFLKRDFERCFPFLETWVTDENEHVRRLVSEGTRPRLPWATRLALPFDRVVELLAQLRRDESAYVRRSVANHLNDLAKDHPEEVIGLLEKWFAEGHVHTEWIVRHALRNHLKAGDKRALKLFGYGEPNLKTVTVSAEPSAVQLDQDVTISIGLENAGRLSQKLMVDLILHYQKANGSTSPKVFKCKDTTLDAGQMLLIEKRFTMTHRSTRKLYPGQHNVQVQVNGELLGQAEFSLDF